MPGLLWLNPATTQPAPALSLCIVDMTSGVPVLLMSLHCSRWSVRGEAVASSLYGLRRHLQSSQTVRVVRLCAILRRFMRRTMTARTRRCLMPSNGCQRQTDGSVGRWALQPQSSARPGVCRACQELSTHLHCGRLPCAHNLRRTVPVSSSHQCVPGCSYFGRIAAFSHIVCIASGFMYAAMMLTQETLGIMKAAMALPNLLR